MTAQTRPPALSSGGCWRYPQRAQPGAWRAAARAPRRTPRRRSSQPLPATRTAATDRREPSRPTARAARRHLPTAAAENPARAPTAEPIQTPTATPGTAAAAHLVRSRRAVPMPTRPSSPARHRGPRRHRALRQEGQRRHHQAQHLHRPTTASNTPPPPTLRSWRPWSSCAWSRGQTRAGHGLPLRRHAAGEPTTRAASQAAVKAAGGEMEVDEPHEIPRRPHPEGQGLKQWQVYGDILEADVVINVPIAKDHGWPR